MTRSKTQEQDEGDGYDDPKHDVLVFRPFAPEINQDDSHTVESVKQDRRNQAELGQTDDRSLVGVDYRVVGLWADANGAVSRVCTRRKKKIATPVMRWRTHDHIPVFPR